MPAASNATILIIDDTPENLVVLSELLRPLYRVLAATSGEAGLRVAGGAWRTHLRVPLPRWGLIVSRSGPGVCNKCCP